jgi:hypothetical protein
MLDRADFLRTLLLLDAASCLATGVVMTLATPALSSMTLIPGSTLRLAGLGLFRIAAVSALVAVRPPPLAGVRLIFLGNAAWAVGSFVLPFDALAELEFMGLRRMPARA